MGSQICPFCGTSETDRLDLDGRRILIFGCLFSPSVDPALSEEALAEHLRTNFVAGDPSYFRGMCDRLHYYVTKGPAARELGASPQ